ncbi:MAG: cyclic nucleotide-binding domain-containing protein, partial [Gammaproteobacteria bacterium]|nr:cyclic nucleotide-binding domain-containing protein [Gammaproteobacteria bacterium]
NETVTLAQQALCAGLEANQVKFLESICKPLSLAKDKLLFSRGKKADSLFFVLQGELNVQLDNGRGQTQRLATLRAGMAVGELALVTGQDRTANVLAISSTRLLELPYSQIPDDIKAVFLKNIVLQLASKLAEQNKEIQYFLND